MNYKNLFPVTVLVCVTLFLAYDIVADLTASEEALPHIIFESIVFFIIIAILLREFRQLRQLKDELSEERVKTSKLSGELLTFMRHQFTLWGLSPSESEVALLLIKGLSMKEIALARKVKEKTVRQQATNIYAKSGYAGRHELVAHFIEDLMSEDPAENQAGNHSAH